MPYIYDAQAEALLAGRPIPDASNAGELNFLFSSIAAKYLRENGLKYSTLNDIVGALDSAKAELQRRVVGPYEDTKLMEPKRVDPYKDWIDPYKD